MKFEISTLSSMAIDKNGDGIIDAVLAPKLGDTVTLDVTPPELQLTFSTTTKSLVFVGTDDSGIVTVATSTVYQMLKKNQKEKKEEKKYRGIATTTVIARDGAGNTTVLVYTERFPSPKERDMIIFQALAYNGATTTLASTALSYKWRTNKNNVYQVFTSHARTASSALESHYRPKKNVTVIMTKPQELDDREDDDDSDKRAVKQTLPGMVVPYMMTKQGSVIINY